MNFFSVEVYVKLVFVCIISIQLSYLFEFLRFNLMSRVCSQKLFLVFLIIYKNVLSLFLII